MEKELGNKVLADRSRRIMVMTIQHNIEAMNAYRQMNITGGTLAKSARNLSSGYKINIAADDAAGLSISEKMRKQIRGLTKASENSEDGISMVQVADGAMAEVHDMLDRCIELSIQAANGTNSDSDRAKIQDEIDQIIKEIDGISERTKFNEVYVLKGEVDYKYKKTGTEIINEGTMPAWVSSPSFDPANAVNGKSILSETFTKTVTTGTISSTTVHAAASLDFSRYSASNRKDLYGKGFHTTCCGCPKYYSVEFISGTVSSKELIDGAYVYKLGIDNIDTPKKLVEEIINLVDGGNPAGHNTMFEQDTTNLGKLWVYDKPDGRRPDPQSNWGVFGEGVMRSRPVYERDKRFENSKQLALQVGSDAGNLMNVRLATISSQALGIDKINVRGFIYEEQEREDDYGNKYKVLVKRQSGADKAIEKFSSAKDRVSADRSRLGAYQNRLEHTVKNLDNVVENTTAAESQIRDTDMAKEMVRYSNANIMMQAGQSMLSQANQSRQGILSLLAA